MWHQAFHSERRIWPFGPRCERPYWCCNG
ncbi:MAG: hypothetical protein HON99_07900 [Crocinitomicaceae bacterium]|nr:hypothetical protein [Crocinitomicaceae bacterium]